LNYSHFPVLEEGFSLAVLPLKISKFDNDKKMIDYKYSLEPFFTRTFIWIEVLKFLLKNRTKFDSVWMKNNYWLLIEDIMSFSPNTFFKEPGRIIKN
jgi:hypothetical protein